MKRTLVLGLALLALLGFTAPASAAETVEIQAFTTEIVDTAPWGTPLPFTAGKVFFLGEVTTSSFGAEVVFDARGGRRCESDSPWGLPPGFEDECKIINPRPVRARFVQHYAFFPTDDPTVFKSGDSTLTVTGEGAFDLVLSTGSYEFHFKIEPFDPDAVVYLYRRPGIRE